MLRPQQTPAGASPPPSSFRRFFPTDNKNTKVKLVDWCLCAFTAAAVETDRRSAEEEAP